MYYLESFRNPVGIFGEKESFEFYGVLYKIDEKIRRFGFCRINHSYIVALSHIRKIRGGYVVLDNGKEISIGRRYRAGFLETIRHRQDLLLNR